MGRKSNRKKLSRQIREKSFEEEKKLRFIAYMIIFPAVGLLVWSFILLDKTFIRNNVVIIPAFLGGVVGTIFLLYKWRKRKFPLWVIVFYGLISGASMPTFLITSTNYYFSSKMTISESLDIVETGNRSRRKSRCKKPYAVVEYHEIKKELLFTCEYEKTISNYKKVELQLSQGLWGFYVIRKKKLVY